MCPQNSQNSKLRQMWAWVLFFFLLLGLTPAAQAQRASAAYRLYHDTLNMAESASRDGLSARAISDIYLKGASQIRDLGGWKYVIELFEKAVDEDPTYVRPQRLYGDYLMGYRGMYERAAEQYWKAIKSIETWPDATPRQEKIALERSLYILYRDGDNGVGILLTEPVSVFLELVGEYANPQELPLDLDGLDRNAQRFGPNTDALYLRRFGYVPLDSEIIDVINGVTVTKSAQRAELNRLRNGDLDLQQNVLRRGGILTLRLGPSYLPYVRASYERNDIHPKSYPRDLSNRTQGRIGTYALSVHKNLVVPGWVDLRAQGSFSREEAITLYNGGRLLTEENTEALNGEVSIAKDLGNDTIKLTLGGQTGQIDDKALPNDAKKAAWNLAARYSQHPLPKPGKGDSRFKGQISQHLEMGYRETLRDYISTTDPITTERHHIPHVAYEGYGLWNRNLDFVAKYEYEQRSLDEQTRKFRDDVHELFFFPAWVMVYKLYDPGFVWGIEHMRLGVPTTVYFGQGTYDTVTVGIQWEMLYVTQWGFSLKTKLGGDYMKYTDVRRDDFGIFVQMNLEAGPNSILAGASQAVRQIHAWGKGIFD